MATFILSIFCRLPMVRDVTPRTFVSIPDWLNRRKVEERAEEKGISFDEAREELWKEANDE